MYFNTFLSLTICRLFIVCLFLISISGFGYAAETTALTLTLKPTTFTISTLPPTITPFKLINNNTARTSIQMSSTSQSQMSPNATLLMKKSLSSVFMLPSSKTSPIDRTFSVFGGISHNPPSIVPKPTAYFGAALSPPKVHTIPVYLLPHYPPKPKQKKRKKKGRYSSYYGKSTGGYSISSYGRPQGGYPSSSYGKPSSSYGTSLGTPLSFYEPPNYSGNPTHSYEPHSGGYSASWSNVPQGGYPSSSYRAPLPHPYDGNPGIYGSPNKYTSQTNLQYSSSNQGNNNHNQGLSLPQVILQPPKNPLSSGYVTPPQSFGDSLSVQQKSQAIQPPNLGDLRTQNTNNFEQQNVTSPAPIANSQLTIAPLLQPNSFHTSQFQPNQQMLSVPQQVGYSSSQPQGSHSSSQPQGGLSNPQTQQQGYSSQQFISNQQHQPIFSNNQYPAQAVQQSVFSAQQQPMFSTQQQQLPMFSNQQQQPVFSTQQQQQLVPPTQHQQQNGFSSQQQQPAFSTQQQQPAFSTQQQQQQPVFSTQQQQEQPVFSSQQQQQQPVFSTQQQQQPVFSTQQQQQFVFSTQQQQPAFSSQQQQQQPVFSTQQQQQPVFSNQQQQQPAFSSQQQQQQPVFSTQQQQQQPVFSTQQQQQQPVFSSQQQQPAFSTQQQQQLPSYAQVSPARLQQPMFTTPVPQIPNAQPQPPTASTVYVGTPQPTPNHFKFVFINPPVQSPTIPPALPLVQPPAQQPPQDVYYVVKKKQTETSQPIQITLSQTNEETKPISYFGGYKSSISDQRIGQSDGSPFHFSETIEHNSAHDNSLPSPSVTRISHSSSTIDETPWSPIITHGNSVTVPDIEAVRVGLQAALSSAYKSISEDYNY